MSVIVDRFSRIHRDAPARLLLHLPSTSTSLSADDVWCASVAHRRALAALGLRRGDLVVLAIGNNWLVFPLWLACLAEGVVIMPVDVGATASEISEVSRRFGATFAIVPSAFASTGTIGEQRPFVAGLCAIRVHGAVAAPELCLGAAVLKLTSGSTGPAKATFTTEPELVVDTIHIVEAMGIGPDDTQIAAIPLSHAYGLGNILVCALTQGTPVVLRDGFVPAALFADARRYAARVFPGVPFMFDRLAAASPAEGWPACLKTLVSAGARLEPSTIRQFFEVFGLKVHSFYGTSETGGIAYDDSDQISDEPGVGRVMPRVTVTLRPEDGAPPGGGRVHVASDAVASRYAGELVGDGDFDQAGFLTGDFGRFNERNHLVLTGRVSRFINVAGRKVQPEEVEQVLLSMPAVADARVLGVPDATRGQQIVACLVPSAGERNILAVRQFCAARLAAHKLPRMVVWLDRIPLTERGKTDRVQLEARVREQLDSGQKIGVL